MITAVLKLLVLIHAWWVAGAHFTFKIVERSKRDTHLQTGWDSAHHVVEGKNGGELLIPRTSAWFPEALWEDWALIYRLKPKRRNTWNQR